MVLCTRRRRNFFLRRGCGVLVIEVSTARGLPAANGLDLLTVIKTNALEPGDFPKKTLIAPRRFAGNLVGIQNKKCSKGKLLEPAN